MTTIMAGASPDPARRVDAPAAPPTAATEQPVPAIPVDPNAPVALTAEVAAATANRPGHAGGFAGASLLRSVLATQGALAPVDAALQRLTSGWQFVSEFEPARHQADIDTFLATIADPAALFPRDGKLDHSPAAELRARFPERHGNYAYFHLLIQTAYGSDLAKASAIADKLLDELPGVRWSNRIYSAFSPYYDPVSRDDIGGMTYGVATHRVLPALMQVAMRLGPDAPFSKRLVAHVEQDMQSRAEVLGYFAAGVDKTPPLIRNWTRAMSPTPHPNEVGHTSFTARSVFAYHLTGRKPSLPQLLSSLSTMYWSEIPSAIATMHRDFDLPYTSDLALAVAPPLLATHSFTDNRYLERIATLGTIVDKAERNGEAGARAKLLAHIAAKYPLGPHIDEGSVHLGVVHLLVKNELSTLTIEDIDGVVATYFAARAARSDMKIEPEQRSLIVDPIGYLAKQIKQGSRTAQREGQPANVLANSIQEVLEQHGFGGPDGFGRYLAQRQRLEGKVVSNLGSVNSALAELLTVVGSSGSFCRSDWGFASLSGTEEKFRAAFAEAQAARIAHERTVGYRARAAWTRFVSWLST